MSSIAVPFLSAFRSNAPAHQEQDFVVTYSMLWGCGGDCCTKTKTIRALSHQDARRKFESKFRLTWVVKTDRA